MSEDKVLHSWCLNDMGEIDLFAYESGFHNGPICEVCEFDFCEHCEKHRPKSGWDNECDGIAPEQFEES